MPASLTFDLGGVYATATFTVPTDEVDPGEATQALELDDLTVMIDGQVADADDFSGTPVANFAFGNFMGVGVTITDSIPSQFTSIEVANNTVTGYSTPVSTTTAFYDLADTQAIFTFSDGVSGAISYDIPLDQADPANASQSLPMSNFALSIAGHVLTPSTANFTTSPTAQFEYGILTGITFAIDTSTISGFPYSSVSVSGWTASAVDAISGLGVTAVLAPAGTGSVGIDFAKVQGDSAAGVIDAGTITITVRTQGNQTYTSTVTFTQGISKETLAATVASDLEDQGLTSVTTAGTGLKFKGPANDPISTVTVHITNNSKPAGAASKGITLTITRN